MYENNDHDVCLITRKQSMKLKQQETLVTEKKKRRPNTKHKAKNVTTNF